MVIAVCALTFAIRALTFISINWLFAHSYDNSRKIRKGSFYRRSQSAHCYVIESPSGNRSFSRQSQCAHWYVIESPFRNRSGCMQQMRQRWETTQSHCARWKQTYVSPFTMRRMRNLFSVDSRNERKRVPDNARKETKVTKTGHFGEMRLWGFGKNAPMGITMRGQILCAYSL
jgi:hypothetical protein